MKFNTDTMPPVNLRDLCNRINELTKREEVTA